MTIHTSRASRDTLAALVIVAVAIVFLAAAGIYRQAWVWDFWNHVAIARTIAEHPGQLVNPFVLSSTVELPYWPYLALVGGVAKITGIPIPLMLGLAGIANTLLLLYAIRKFYQTIGAPPDAVWIGTIFLFTVWGGTPWALSGILSLGLYPYTAPYPSTFATALLLLLVCTLVSDQPLRSRSRWFALSVGTLLLGLIHPILLFSFGICASAVVCSDFIRPLLPRVPRSVRLRWNLLVLATIGLALLGAAFWPAFPLIETIGIDRYRSDPNARVIYQNAVGLLLPAIVAGTATLFSLRHRPPLFSIGVMIIALIVVYFGAGYAEQWNFGRAVIVAVILLQLSAAWPIAALISRVKSFQRIVRISVPILFLVTTITVGYSLPEQSTSSLRFKTVQRLTAELPRDLVVLADAETSMILPALGFRVVWFPYPVFIPDQRAEREALFKKVFKAGIPPTAQELSEFKVALLVLSNKQAKQLLSPTSENLLHYRIIAGNDDLTIVSIAP